MTDQPAPQNLSPEHLVTLYEITAVMNSSLEFDAALDNIIDAVMHVTRAQRGYILTVDPDDTNNIEVLAARATDGKEIDDKGYSTSTVDHVVKTGQTLLTNNAQDASEYSPGQSIIIRGLRAIVCAPMLAKNRFIGVIYVDTSMRKGNFTEADRDLLSAVAGQAAIALENARLYTIAVEKGRLERELQMASEIQQSLLPQVMPKLEGYDVAARWRAAREVAGDFYDVFKLDDDHMAVVIADVSDKGAPAALFMAVSRTMIRSHAHAGLTARETVNRTNDLILEDASGGGMFVTVYYSILNSDAKSVHVNAGHNPPIYYNANEGKCYYMPRGGMAVGWFPNNASEEVELDFNVGDMIIYYTDGITEAENPRGDFYGEERLEAVIMANTEASASDMIDIITRDVVRFVDGAPPMDDMTLVVVKYCGV